RNRERRRSRNRRRSLSRGGKGRGGDEKGRWGMTSSSETVGFIGLGIMGLPMAKNVLRGGYPLVAWNRTASKVDELADAGAERAESPADVGARANVVVTCVRGTEDVEQVVFGQPGVPGVIEG